MCPWAVLSVDVQVLREVDADFQLSQERLKLARRVSAPSLLTFALLVLILLR